MFKRIPTSNDFVRYPLTTPTALVRCSVCNTITDDAGIQPHISWHVAMVSEFDRADVQTNIVAGWNQLMPLVKGEIRNALSGLKETELWDDLKDDAIDTVRSVLLEIVRESMGEQKKEPRRIKRPVVAKENEE